MRIRGAGGAGGAVKYDGPIRSQARLACGLDRREALPGGRAEPVDEPGDECFEQGERRCVDPAGQHDVGTAASRIGPAAAACVTSALHSPAAAGTGRKGCP
jgi:hypothetical protein